MHRSPRGRRPYQPKVLGEDRRSAGWLYRDLAIGAQTGGGGLLPLMGLALLAGLIEVPSMLPYLGAIGAITTSGILCPV